MSSAAMRSPGRSVSTGTTEPQASCTDVPSRMQLPLEPPPLPLPPLPLVPPPELPPEPSDEPSDEPSEEPDEPDEPEPDEEPASEEPQLPSDEPLEPEPSLELPPPSEELLVVEGEGSSVLEELVETELDDEDCEPEPLGGGGWLVAQTGI